MVMMVFKFWVPTKILGVGHLVMVVSTKIFGCRPKFLGVGHLVMMVSTKIFGCRPKFFGGRPSGDGGVDQNFWVPTKIFGVGQNFWGSAIW